MNLNKKNSNTLTEVDKNVATGTFLETSIESGFLVMTYQNEFDTPKVL